MGSQNIKNLRSDSLNSVSLPDELKKDKELRVVLIKHKEKRPFEKDWNKNKNYPADSPILPKHLAQGGNYGILCGFGGLVVFDSDNEERLRELGVIAKLPRTFTVRTGGGGNHRYYICFDLKKRIVLFDPILKDHNGEPLHLGEIQSRGQQIVGPGSVHPNGNRYLVIDDSEIAVITKDELLEAIQGLKTSKKRDSKEKNPTGKKDKTVKKNNKNRRQSPGDAIQIRDIAMLEGDVQKREGKNGTEYFGAHPVHGSETGKNFHINIDKNVWHCHRHSSGGGPLEWLAVKHGIISCSQAGPKCLDGEKYRHVLDVARELGYKIPEKWRQVRQFEAIEKRLKSDTLPEDLPPDQVVVIKGPPRIGKTYWSVKQLIKAGSGNYITHNHSIVDHALHILKKQGGCSAVHLEGKSRPGMCRNQGKNCKVCELSPNQHDDNHIDYIELERRARDLLRNHGILTKKEIPTELCPYYTLKLAEKSANYCFTVPHFIEEIETRKLIVLDEDPTLSYFYPPSPVLCRYKKDKNENKLENVLGKALEQAPKILEHIKKKKRINKEDKLLMWSIDTFGGINEVIKTTMSGKRNPEDCCCQIEEQLAQESKVAYDDETIEKALRKLDEDHIDYSPEVDLRDYIRCWFHIYGKKPLFSLVSGRSGYTSVHLIGDATRPAVNMNWSATVMKSGQKLLIIGNTLAELFGKALGNAVVIEISDFKYAKNYVVIPIDSSGEDSYDGQVKNQRLKVKKFIKILAGDPDNKDRHPVMALTGSKRNQDALVRSIGGICHPSQGEGETGQQWNYQSGMVNVFYQNSTISRGLDVDQYNVLFVHDADFAQPFWSAAIEAEEDSAEDILDSIVMDETTNSVLRISPITGGDEHRPKCVIMPRNGLWKVRYIDDRVLDAKRGGRTHNIEDIAMLLKESNIVGMIHLNELGTLIYDNSIGSDWAKAVQENKLLDMFRIELDRVSSRGKYTEEELVETGKRIFEVLKRAGRCRWISIKDMRAEGLKCKDAVIRPALERMHYEGKASWKKRGKRILWSLTKNS